MNNNYMHSNRRTNWIIIQEPKKTYAILKILQKLWQKYVTHINKPNAMYISTRNATRNLFNNERTNKNSYSE